MSSSLRWQIVAKFICLHTLIIVTGGNVGYFGGIPVPGRRLPALSSFELYLSECRPNSQQNQLFSQIQQVLQHIDAEQIAEKILRNLYIAVDEIDTDKLLGKWYTVVDSNMHSEHCVVSYIKPVEHGRHSDSISIRQYSKNSENVKMIQGDGHKMGPDPMNFHFHTGHPADVCPYFPIKVGPVSKSGLYEYIILTQALKYPTVVLARDALDFETVFATEVHDYLDHYGYMNPIAALNQPLHFMNATNCFRSNNYYNNIVDDSTA